jgi:hypothetical protein
VDAQASASSTSLPPIFGVVQERFPWEGVVQGAGVILVERLPELSAEISALDARVFGLSSGFFYLPAALAVEWGRDDDESLERLLSLLAIGHGHFAFQDLVIDNGGAPAQLCLVSDTCLLTYLDLLEHEAPAIDKGQYRRWHDLYYRWYVDALKIEMSHRCDLSRFTSEEILKMGMKAAPGNTTIHLVADWTGHESSAEGAVAAVMYLCAGLQVLDDLNDLSEDFAEANYSMPLTEIILSLGPDGSPEALESKDLLVVAAENGVFASCLDIADSLFSLAERTAASMEIGVIADLANTWRRRTGARRDLLLEAMVPSDVRR